MLTSTGVIRGDPPRVLGHDRADEPDLDSEIANLEKRKQALQHQRDQRIRDLQARIKSVRDRLYQLAQIQQATAPDPNADPDVKAACKKFNAAIRALQAFPRYQLWPGAKYDKQVYDPTGGGNSLPYNDEAYQRWRQERERLHQQCLTARAAYSEAFSRVYDASRAELRQRQEAAAAEAEELSDRLDELNEQLAALGGSKH